ncbi:hypothetical protein [Paraburkholderia tropica]|uniref:hypothetical protein n=1 Tax=Paraburkholderia tropica TaxID=92647 RepID=UPI002ABD6B4E|nr:hypothetical protein [Paraburkholderia tropica]
MTSSVQEETERHAVGELQRWVALSRTARVLIPCDMKEEDRRPVQQQRVEELKWLPKNYPNNFRLGMGMGSKSVSFDWSVTQITSEIDEFHHKSSMDLATSSIAK